MLPQTIVARRDAATIGGQAGTDSRMGMFLSPFTYVTSAQSQAAPPGPETGAENTNEMTPRQMAELQEKARLYLGMLDDPIADNLEKRMCLEEKMQADPRIAIRFVAQMKRRQEKMAAQQKAAQGLAVITKKKRKEPSTPSKMPSSKRQVIDLTDDSDQDPTDATHQPRTMQVAPSVVYKNPTSSAIPDVLISNDGNDALHSHTTTHGVHMSDVELDNSTRRNTMNWAQQRKDLRAASCLLNPSEVHLRRMARVNAQELIPTYIAEPTVAAAYNKVRSGQLDFTFEAIHVPETTVPTTEEYLGMGCTLDADGSLRAPEDEVPSEECADLMWALQ
jgi:hypothetical protein